MHEGWFLTSRCSIKSDVFAASATTLYTKQIFTALRLGSAEPGPLGDEGAVTQGLSVTLGRSCVFCFSSVFKLSFCSIFMPCFFEVSLDFAVLNYFLHQF